MLSIKALLSKILQTDLVVDSGMSSTGWAWKKYASGHYEAERTWNIGQVTLSTAPATNYRVSADITVSTPSAMSSGSVQATLQGSSSGSPIFLENISASKIRIAKIANTSVTLQNVTIILRTVNARWK